MYSDMSQVSNRTPVQPGQLGSPSNPLTLEQSQAINEYQNQGGVQQVGTSIGSLIQSLIAKRQGIEEPPLFSSQNPTQDDVLSAVVGGQTNSRNADQIPEEYSYLTQLYGNRWA